MEKKPRDAPSTQGSETPFQRFKRLAKKVVTVPKPKSDKKRGS